MQDSGDEFELYNLRVEVVGDPNTYVCSHVPGYAFEVIGENILFTNSPDKSFSLYSLASLLPLLPAKQRFTSANDWMTTDEIIACPDRNCGAGFQITRVGTKKFKHSEVTKEPLEGGR